LLLKTVIWHKNYILSSGCISSSPCRPWMAGYCRMWDFLNK